MSNLLGSVGEFAVGGKESFESYLERVELFFTANGVVDDVKKKAIFLTVCGSELYQLIRNLVTPSKPVDKTLKEITDAVSSHISPKPNEICERFRFRNRYRKSGENVSDYVAELRNLSQFCNYETCVDTEIRDQLVCGINDVGVQQKLLSEKDLTFKHAVELAIGVETAERESKAMVQWLEVLEKWKRARYMAWTERDRVRKRFVSGVVICNIRLVIVFTRIRNVSFVARKVIFRRCAVNERRALVR